MKNNSALFFLRLFLASSLAAIALPVGAQLPPPADAFWSITVYDTERGGFLHPNDDDRYHINNTAAIRNDDGTVTFTFKQDCESSDLNCLEVPAGRFDVTSRYYLPHEEIIIGEWTLPKIELQAD